MEIVLGKDLVQKSYLIDLDTLLKKLDFLKNYIL